MKVTAVPRPAYDVELQPYLTANPPASGSGAVEEFLRSPGRGAIPDPAPLVRGRGIEHLEYTVPGPPGAPDITLSVFRRTDHASQGPGIYYIHGGGMIGGNRFDGHDLYLPWVERYDVVVVSVEYRVAPEHPDPAPIEDCYAGLLRVAASGEELGLDADRLLVAGRSAGGGLAAGTALLARDRGGPALIGQLLHCPMLDDRDETISTRQFELAGRHDREQNRAGWTALLGERRGGPDVSIYAVPARATDLSKLPPAFIDVGSAEVFRDEGVAYASGIWAAGGSAELHVWPGGFHGFEVAVPHASISLAAFEAREHWLRRILGR